MSSRKNGWKVSTETVGDRPRPVVPDKQNALAFHSVMVSGIFTTNSWLPDKLVWREKDRRKQSETKPNQNMVNQ